MRNEMTNNRSGCIDIIRFIGALLIMAHHMYNIGLQYYPFWDCWIYTEFFLLITGYYTAKHFENYGDKFPDNNIIYDDLINFYVDFLGVNKDNLVEEKRPGKYFPVYEDERGTFLFNTEDLCMIEYIPELIKCGITSLRIDGRMKDEEYVAAAVAAYRKAIDAFYENPDTWEFNPLWLEDLNKLNNRNFTSGFYLDNPNKEY